MAASSDEHKLDGVPLDDLLEAVKRHADPDTYRDVVRKLQNTIREIEHAHSTPVYYFWQDLGRNAEVCYWAKDLPHSDDACEYLRDCRMSGDLKSDVEDTMIREFRDGEDVPFYKLDAEAVEALAYRKVYLARGDILSKELAPYLSKN
jgi:hypothetical protein